LAGHADVFKNPGLWFQKEEVKAKPTRWEGGTSRSSRGTVVISKHTRGEGKRNGRTLGGKGKKTPAFMGLDHESGGKQEKKGMVARDGWDSPTWQD